ncbi:hypothetical protein IEQ34_010418 [Dendrobium chrysotoxum]|uniref:Uncharacterized protein n=1 Tax=Dendrobium chrysotoxum TaxID=161865 RepID=A0AAV7H5B5_DENCH|nr:hypothetical protein IEQ34_010418 [Dendrobium chrysotoxum]
MGRRNLHGAMTTILASDLEPYPITFPPLATLGVLVKPIIWSPSLPHISMAYPSVKVLPPAFTHSVTAPHIALPFCSFGKIVGCLIDSSLILLRDKFSLGRPSLEVIHTFMKEYTWLMTIPSCSLIIHHIIIRLSLETNHTKLFSRRS